MLCQEKTLKAILDTEVIYTISTASATACGVKVIRINAFRSAIDFELV